MPQDQLPLFSLHFNGKPELLDAHTLLGSLDAFASIVDELAPLDAETAEYRLKVRANRPGSFIVDLVLSPDAWDVTKSIFTANNLKAASLIVGSVAGLLKIRQLLKKERPASVDKDGGNVTVENSSGASVLVDNRTFQVYMNNSRVNRSIDQHFSSLDADPTVESFAVTDGKESPIFQASRPEFSEMVTGEMPDGEEDRVKTERVMLNIIKVSFERRLKWKFAYRGAPIGAVVADDAFVGLIQAGSESFSRGDILEVELETHQKYDPSLMAYMNHEYRVVKVYNHIRARTQSAMEFPEQDQGDGVA